MFLGVEGLRRYIFMDRERRLLERWIETEGESQEGSELDKAGVADTGRGHEAPIQGGQDDAAPAQVEGVQNTGQQVRLSITARRIRIDPIEKRRSYIRRLERLMVECDRIISDPDGFEDPTPSIKQPEI